MSDADGKRLAELADADIRVVEVEDTPEVRGAIAKLPHMVAVVD